MNILVTGAAGFVGYHVSKRLLDRGDRVHGIDNLNPYYDVSLKRARLKGLQMRDGFCFEQIDIADDDRTQQYFAAHRFDAIVHLAAQAGVRYSLDNPRQYIASNVAGFLNMLEACRASKPNHMVYASSSSVYGANLNMPLSTSDRTDHPISLYGATKKANELMAYSYAHLFGVPLTGLRFFTVYGPWGRPDMAYYKFTQSILNGTPIDIYNGGHHRRDFTYIDDIVEGIVRVLDRPPAPTGGVPHYVYNIGNHQPVELLRMIEVLENALGVRAVKNMLPAQPGDVADTFADVEELRRDVGFAPATSIEDGLMRFVGWFREYYGR